MVQRPGHRAGERRAPGPVAAGLALAGTALLVAALVALAPRPTTLGDAQFASFLELARPRAFAPAVALPTGEILVVGGLDPSDPEVTNAKSELIDPLARVSRVIAHPGEGRVHQSLTLDGHERVVEAGGVVWGGAGWIPVDRVDLFDVRTRRWSAGRPLGTPRSDHAAVALRDGRVAVIGGNRDTRLLASVELYDSRADRWTAAAPLPRARTQHAAVVLRDGRVLVAGGIDADGRATDTTFLYDPVADRWSHGPRMTMPRLQQATVLLPDGNVLLAGGDGEAGSTSEIFVASAGAFLPSGSLSQARLVAQAAALPDGRVVIAGGLPPRMVGYHPLVTVEVWDPRAWTWSALPSLAAGRAWGTLVASRGALYLVSGNGAGEEPFRSIERLLIE